MAVLRTVAAAPVAGGRETEVSDPGDGSLVGIVPRATPADALAVIALAVEARGTAQRLPPHRHMAVLDERGLYQRSRWTATTPATRVSERPDWSR